VFENGVLRRIFGSKRDKVTGEWRRLHSKELYELYGACSMYGERCIQGFGGDTYGKETTWKTQV
jgi:hypothetical protein